MGSLTSIGFTEMMQNEHILYENMRSNIYSTCLVRHVTEAVTANAIPRHLLLGSHFKRSFCIRIDMHNKPAEGPEASQGAAHPGFLPLYRSTKPPEIPPVHKYDHIELLAEK